VADREILQKFSERILSAAESSTVPSQVSALLNSKAAELLRRRLTAAQSKDLAQSLIQEMDGDDPTIEDSPT